MKKRLAGDMDEAQERLDKKAATQMAVTKQGKGTMVPDKNAMKAMQKRRMMKGMAVKGAPSPKKKKKAKNLRQYTRSLRSALRMDY